MPRKATKRDREAALRQSHTARFMRQESPGGGGTDPPIIVQGGGSILLDVPGRFKERGPGGNGGKKFRNDDQDLISVTIDGTEYDVNADSLIEIRYGTRSGGGGRSKA